MNNQENLNLESLKINLKKYLYLVLIFVLSMTVLIIAPMWQNDLGGFHIDLPKSKSGWVAYIMLRATISIVNMLLFACFVQQGELNSKNHPNKLKADEILNNCKIKVSKPRSPLNFRSKQYGGKGGTIMLGSFAALVALPPILAYDWKSALTYLFTIIMSIIFGIYQMMVTEAYWQEEYLQYALMIKEEQSKEVKDD